MKVTVYKKMEIEASTIEIILDVRREDIPSDFPLLDGNTWTASVDIDSGVIEGWPQGEEGDLFVKAVDTGEYRLYAPDGTQLAAKVGDYVPNSIVPGSHGDYVDLHIDVTGKITNWPKNPSLADFFREPEKGELNVLDDE